MQTTPEDCTARVALAGVLVQLAALDARCSAAIVVREHDHRHAGELWVEHALAGVVEGVAVDQRDPPAHRTKLVRAFTWCQRTENSSTLQSRLSSRSSKANS